MDLAKYQALFLEEATEHLAEMSRACLALEKDPANAEAIDLVFRMAHSVKGMAASLEYDGLTRVAHALEDRIATFRSAGAVDVPEGMGLLFRGLEVLEAMVATLRESGDAPPADAAVLAALSGAPATPKKA